MPLIISKCTGGAVEKWHKVELECNTEGAIVLYTMDGSSPEFNGASTRVSNTNSNADILKQLSEFSVDNCHAVDESSLCMCKHSVRVSVTQNIKLKTTN